MCVHANSTTRQRVAEKGVWNDAIFGEQNQNRKDYMKLVMEDKTEGVLEQVIELLPYVRSIKVIGG